MFLRKYKKHMVCGHNILTEGVFVTQLSIDVGISVWRTVWVMANRQFVSIMIRTAGIEWLNSACEICKNSGFKLQDFIFPWEIYKKNKQNKRV
jgi:hypothetical protein